MGLRRLEQGNFTLLGMKYYVVFPQNNQGQSSFPKAVGDKKVSYKN